MLHGPPAGAAAKTYLFGIEDDHSRFITGHWWTTREDTTGLFAALRRAVEAHGAPQAFYVDNGSPYVSRQLLHALAVLGIAITHSRPRRPQGKGKIERPFETVRAQFLVEIAAAGGPAGTPVQSVTALEELFGAWVHQVYRPGGPFRDRTGPGRAVRRGALPAAAAGPAGDRGGVLVAGLPHRDQDRHGQPARQPVPGGPGAFGPQGRAALQPGRPDRRDPGPLARDRHGPGGPARDRPALPPRPARPPRSRRRRPGSTTCA